MVRRRACRPGNAHTGHIEDGVVEVGAVVEAVELHEESLAAVLLEVDGGRVVVWGLDTDSKSDAGSRVVPQVDIAASGRDKQRNNLSESKVLC